MDSKKSYEARKGKDGGNEGGSNTNTHTNKQKPHKPKRSAKVSKTAGKPTRPLSAYNLYFKHERQRLMELARPIEEIYAEEIKPDPGSTKPVDRFQALVKVVSKRWKELPDPERKKFETLAAIEMEKYQEKMNEFRSVEKAGGMKADPEHPKGLDYRSVASTDKSHGDRTVEHTRSIPSEVQISLNVGSDPDAMSTVQEAHGRTNWPEIVESVVHLSRTTLPNSSPNDGMSSLLAIVTVVNRLSNAPMEVLEKVVEILDRDITADEHRKQQQQHQKQSQQQQGMPNNLAQLAAIAGGVQPQSQSGGPLDSSSVFSRMLNKDQGVGGGPNAPPSAAAMAAAAGARGGPDSSILQAAISKLLPSSSALGAKPPSQMPWGANPAVGGAAGARTLAPPQGNLSPLASDPTILSMLLNQQQQDKGLPPRQPAAIQQALSQRLQAFQSLSAGNSANPFSQPNPQAGAPLGKPEPTLPSAKVASVMGQAPHSSIPPPFNAAGAPPPAPGVVSGQQLGIAGILELLKGNQGGAADMSGRGTAAQQDKGMNASELQQEASQSAPRAMHQQGPPRNGAQQGPFSSLHESLVGSLQRPPNQTSPKLQHTAPPAQPHHHALKSIEQIARQQRQEARNTASAPLAGLPSSAGGLLSSLQTPSVSMPGGQAFPPGTGSGASQLLSSAPMSAAALPSGAQLGEAAQNPTVMELLRILQSQQQK